MGRKSFPEKFPKMMFLTNRPTFNSESTLRWILVISGVTLLSIMTVVVIETAVPKSRRRLPTGSLSDASKLIVQSKGRADPTQNVSSMPSISLCDVSRQAEKHQHTFTLIAQKYGKDCAENARETFKAYITATGCTKAEAHDQLKID